MNKQDGMNYAPIGKPQPVVKPDEFVIAAATLDHGHIYGMCNGLIEAGATLKWVYDPDPHKIDQFAALSPGAGGRFARDYPERSRGPAGCRGSYSV